MERNIEISIRDEQFGIFRRKTFIIEAIMEAGTITICTEIHLILSTIKPDTEKAVLTHVAQTRLCL